MGGSEVGIIKKVFALIFLSILLYGTYLATNSLAVLSDAAYALVDALFLFSLWLSMSVVYRKEVTKLALRMTSLSIFILSLVVIFTSSLLLYSSLLGMVVNHGVSNPELIIASELFYIFLLFYLYHSMREEAAERDVMALVSISKDVERNILSSFLVILSALFDYLSMFRMDALVAFLISIYVLYRSLLISYRSFRSVLGMTDPVLVSVIRSRVASMGLRPVSVEVYGIGPYYYVELSVDYSNLPDSWEKVEELIRRRIEFLLPSSARINIKSPGGGI